MTKKRRKILQQSITILLAFGFALGCFYLGVMFTNAQQDGWAKAIKTDAISVFFGIIGGLITSALIAIAQETINGLRHPGKEDNLLTAHWEEEYKADEFPEVKQRQNLDFHLRQIGENLTGTVLGTDAADCPVNERHGPRRFTLTGRKELNLVSFIATLDKDNEVGHTVYLLNISGDGKVLEGQSLYYDLNNHVIASSHCTLRRK